MDILAHPEMIDLIVHSPSNDMPPMVSYRDPGEELDTVSVSGDRGNANEGGIRLGCKYTQHSVYKIINLSPSG